MMAPTVTRQNKVIVNGSMGRVGGNAVLESISVDMTLSSLTINRDRISHTDDLLKGRWVETGNAHYLQKEVRCQGRNAPPRGQDLQRDVPTDEVEAYGVLRTWFFPEFFDFRRRGPESGANGFLETFRFFAGGNGVARREIQKKQGFGVVGSLFMMWIFGECHSGMGNVVVFRVEIGYPGFNLLFPSGRHAHVPAFNFDVHHFPHRLSFISRGFNVLP